MKSWTKLVFFLFIFFLFFFTPSHVNAAGCNEVISPSFEQNNVLLNNRRLPTPISVDEGQINFKINGLEPNKEYRIKIQRDAFADVGTLLCANFEASAITNNNGEVNFSFNESDHPGTMSIIGGCDSTNEVHIEPTDRSTSACNMGHYSLIDQTGVNCNISYSPPYPDKDDSIEFAIAGFQDYQDFNFWFACNRYHTNNVYIELGHPDENGEFHFKLKSAEMSDQLEVGEQNCAIEGGALKDYCNFSFFIREYNEDPTSPVEGEEVPLNLFKPEACSLDEGGEGIQTALGCFPTEARAIVEWILKYAIMAAGGIGFLIMLFASFQIMTSAGDPDKLKNGQQMLTSAIVGILLVVFSLFILRFIGWDVLRIPGFGGGAPSKNIEQSAEKN